MRVETHTLYKFSRLETCTKSLLNNFSPGSRYCLTAGQMTYLIIRLSLSSFSFSFAVSGGEEGEQGSGPGIWKKANSRRKVEKHSCSDSQSTSTPRRTRTIDTEARLD